MQIELNQVLSTENLQHNQSTSKSNLVKQVIVPLTSVVTCGSFLIHCSPLIFTHELHESRRNSEHVKPDESTRLSMPRISSMTFPGKDVDLQEAISSNRYKE